MKLYLIRHAQAEDGSPDFDRSLTRAGRERSLLLAGWLGPWLTGGRLLSSPAARALEMAEILYREIQFEGKLKQDRLLYDGSLETITSMLLRREDQVLAVVGHEPTFSQLAGRMLGGHPALELKKGGVIRLDLQPGRPATLRWLLDPRLLERGPG
ncbi:hypothetical protein DYH09_05800 [bacterium CPR1]|nr:hypothetical protein [bacterium CPR1]